MGRELIERTDDGLYCPAGDFHIDPWNPVPYAAISHAHSDHARAGCGRYLAAEPGRRLLELRLGPIDLTAVPYGAVIERNGVSITFVPAGHVLGSSQIRVEHRGEVWVVSGDYKLDTDPTCAAFEPVRCHTFVTESTFGLPVYRWDDPSVTFAAMNDWCRSNRDAGRTSVVFAYSLGKAQRVMAGIDSTVGPIYTHGAVENVTRAYRESGVTLPPTVPVGDVPRGKDRSWVGGLVIAPPSADGSPWARKFEPASTAIASGWMTTRGVRRRRSVDRGFALSDHADWPGLLKAVAATGATRVLATHGSAAVLARYLRENGLDAGVLATRFGDDDEPETPGAPGS